MSLLILAFLIGIGLIFIFILREYELEHEENNISEYAMNILVGYNVALLFASIGSVGAGIFWWLKEGSWLSINTYYLTNKLEKGNYFRELLLSETSWAGLQEISAWYLQQNIGWSFIITIVLLYFILIFTTK